MGSAQNRIRICVWIAVSGILIFSCAYVAFENRPNKLLQIVPEHSRDALRNSGDGVSQSEQRISKIVGGNALQPLKDNHKLFKEKVSDPLITQIQQFEVQNFKIVSNRKFGVWNVSILEIPRLAQEQIQAVHGVLSRSLKDVPPERRAQFAERGVAIINDYLTYPKDHKFLQILEPENNEKAPVLFEIFTDYPDQGNPNADGVLEMNYGGGNRIKSDSKFGTKGTWGTQRYGHLVEFNFQGQHDTPAKTPGQ